MVVGGLVALFGLIKVIIHAFKSAGVLHAIICFLCALYALYWVFAKYDASDKKVVIIALIGGTILYYVGAGMAGAAMAAAS